jgi:hypothetical protein
MENLSFIKKAPGGAPFVWYQRGQAMSSNDAKQIKKSIQNQMVIKSSKSKKIKNDSPNYPNGSL